MIPTLLRISWTNLRRDRVAQSMTFLLPIVFFSIFAMVFGGRDRAATNRVTVAVVDESGSDVSARLVAALEADSALRIVTRARAPRHAAVGAGALLDRAAARAMVRAGDVPVAMVLPRGIETSFARTDGGGVAVELFADPSDPVASRVAGGLLQRAAMRVVTGATGPGPAAGDMNGLVRVHVVDVMHAQQEQSLIPFYAAGVAVMFLLFSCSGAAGTLLDEVDSGTLDRVLTTEAGMGGLLAGKWIYLTLLGVLQITVMFIYGMLAFRLDLLHHLPGFAVMTAFTAATCAAFGLVLATACRTRAQLSGLSTITILCISAIGGSMFPRFLMSPTMQRIGLVTFNTWALDGFTKVFWRDAPVRDLLPQVGVLVAFMTAFLIAARLFARRWERA